MVSRIIGIFFKMHEQLPIESGKNERLGLLEKNIYTVRKDSIKKKLNIFLAIINSIYLLNYLVILNNNDIFSKLIL